MEIIQHLKNKNATIGIIGLGYVGLPLMLSFIKENVKVIGLTPEWMNPKSTYFPIFRDCERVFSKKPFKKLMNRTFLLRRDRYVAASKTFEKTDDLIPIMQALMAKA